MDSERPEARRRVARHPIGYVVVAVAGLLLGYLFHLWLSTPPPNEVALGQNAVVHVDRQTAVQTPFRSCGDVVVAATDNLDAAINQRTCALRLSGDYRGKAALRVILFDARGYARDIGLWSGRVE